MEAVSEYYLTLTGEVKKRYESKVAKAGLKIDPYKLESWSSNPDEIPDIAWSDIMVYMTETPSPYTGERIKAPEIILFCLPSYTTGNFTFLLKLKAIAIKR